MLKEAREFSPHIIGASTFITFINYMYLLLETLAQARLGALIGAGGPHATIVSKEPLLHGADMVVRGEGEKTLLETVDHIQGKKKLRCT